MIKPAPVVTDPGAAKLRECAVLPVPAECRMSPAAAAREEVEGAAGASGTASATNSDAEPVPVRKGPNPVEMK